MAQTAERSRKPRLPALSKGLGRRNALMNHGDINTAQAARHGVVTCEAANVSTQAVERRAITRRSGCDGAAEIVDEELNKYSDMPAKYHTALTEAYARAAASPRSVCLARPCSGFGA